MNTHLCAGLLFLALCLTEPVAHAQNLEDMFHKAKNELTGKDGGNSISSLSNADISAGLRQALQEGTKNAANRLNKTDGFFGNALIKVLVPPDAKKMESTLRNLGMGDMVDKAILSMNRAAEDAAIKAVPIFVDAITSMSIEDAMSILKGGNGAATNFLKNKTTAALTKAFRPVIETSLQKVNATAYWKDVVNAYNQLPTTFNKINPDLAGYVTERALNGLFLNIADEENKIRKDPAARVTDLLKKVFGAK
jgi:hypothetical protein